MDDAVGLVDGLYAGSAAAGFRNFPESGDDRRRRASARSTPRARSRSRGSAGRLRSRWPIRRGPVLRNVEAGSLAARLLYPEVRQTRPEALPRSPVIGTDAPVQYEQRDDIGAPRRRLPPSAAEHPAEQARPGYGAGDDVPS